MKIHKYILTISVTFLFILNIFICWAGGQENIIIGTWGVPKDNAYNYVLQALNFGYKNIDTAKMYGNELEVGQAIKDYENKTRNRVNVTTKFKIEQTPMSLKEYIQNLLNASIDNLGHVDEFLLHEAPENGTQLTDVLNVFLELHKNKVYANISFGLSNVSIYDISCLDAKYFDVVKVIQNPYWHGSDSFLDMFSMGKDMWDFCKRYNIKYETYKTLGHGHLMKEKPANYASRLVNAALNKGFWPIVKASSKEHLRQLSNDSETSYSFGNIDNSDLLNYSILYAN